jgi:hypothetical protein
MVTRGKRGRKRREGGCKHNNKKDKIELTIFDENSFYSAAKELDVICSFRTQIEDEKLFLVVCIEKSGPAITSLYRLGEKQGNRCTRR